MRLRVTAVLWPFLVVLPLFAAQQRSFVSTSGLDTNPCNLASPCRTFAAAIAQTNADGEVVVLDSAGYGVVTITQPVAIVAAAGVHAEISVFTGAGVTVNAPGGRVTLRNLFINGQGGDTGPGSWGTSGRWATTSSSTTASQTADARFRRRRRSEPDQALVVVRCLRDCRRRSETATAERRTIACPE